MMVTTLAAAAGDDDDDDDFHNGSLLCVMYDWIACCCRLYDGTSRYSTCELQTS